MLMFRSVVREPPSVIHRAACAVVEVLIPQGDGDMIAQTISWGAIFPSSPVSLVLLEISLILRGVCLILREVSLIL